MELFHLEQPIPDGIDEAVVVLAIDGWTDAGRGGSIAAEQVLEQLPNQRLGAFDGDALFDYRDRRPLLQIDEGQLGDPQWPELTVHLLSPPGGPSLVLVSGTEPDFRWQVLCRDLVELAERLDADRYVGLGAVPGPIPHTRPARVIATSSEPELPDQVARPHERVVVPSSFQVVVETALRDAGVETLGLWVRIPHYVAGEYPEGAQVLLQQLTRHLSLPLDTGALDDDVEEHRQRLDVAASGSPDVEEHISELEEAYDSDTTMEGGLSGPLPTGDQIAAEVERFLRDQDE